MVQRPSGIPLPHKGIMMRSTMRYSRVSPEVCAKLLKSNATHYLRRIAAHEQGERDAIAFLRSIGR